MSLEAQIQDLLEAAAGLVDGALDDGAAVARNIRQTNTQTNTQTPRLAPRTLPACRHWAPALAATDDAMAALLAPLGDVLHWRQNPNYTAATMGAGYMENYAYATVVGSRGLIDHKAYALGVLLLGPGLTYPPHSHPANEVYYVVGGEAQWQQDDGPWIARGPGSLIHNPSGIIHATRSGASPLLVLYLWWGDVETNAKLEVDTSR